MVYREFMMEVLYALEPRIETKNTVIYRELEEINAVIFITNGTHEIGYEINGESKFILRYRNSNVIGAYAITFDKKSQFIHKTVTECHGFFIRRNKWKFLM